MTVTITGKQTTTLNVKTSNETWVVAAGSSIKVANGHGMVNNLNYHDSVLVASGDIVADGQYSSGMFSEGAKATLKVDTTGSIHGYNGMAFYGEGTLVENLGKITATNIGIYGNAKDMDLFNTGTIIAKTGLYLENAYSSMSGFTNSGTITADKGIFAVNGGVGIHNTVDGHIDAKLTAVTFGQNKNNQNFLFNEGMLESDDIAIQGSGTRDSITNRGTIKGRIVLGDGDDTFDNDGGTIDHAVDGGLGGDSYGFGAGKFDIVDAGGIDTISSTISRSLAPYANIENLFLYGTGNINGTGNALANDIFGYTGNNILDGGNDNAVDRLVGGDGNDTYVLGSGNDIVYESANNSDPFNDKGGGIDTITSTISRSLDYVSAESESIYLFVENLKLLGTGNINGTGNALANVITGNAGNNILNGGADTLVDTLNGGAGNDTYVLGSGSDKVIDSAGTDAITSTISRNLSTFSAIENLKLLGASNINATGNALANALSGNSGTNALSGAAGNDTLNGGAGADKLDGGTGTDTASYAGSETGITANLAKASINTGDAKGDTYVSIENLKGSSHNDVLTGNTGANSLYGTTGADKLTGGTGADTFLFTSAGDTTVATAGQDTIFDFSHSQGDKISLSGIDANSSLTADQHFIFKGTAAFSGIKGELHFNKQASDTYVSGDINGDKVADFVLHFDDAIAFQASDFLL